MQDFYRHLYFHGSHALKKGVQSIPPADQIFNGLTFYFIPNNDIAAPRRKRIEKGLQYGAVWEKVWPGSVTHVIVDSNVAMKDVLRILGLDKLPVSYFPLQRYQC